MAAATLFISGCGGGDDDRCHGKYLPIGEEDKAYRLPLAGHGVLIVENKARKENDDDDDEEDDFLDAVIDVVTGADEALENKNGLRVFVDGDAQKAHVKTRDGGRSWKAFDLLPGPHTVRITRDGKEILSGEIIAVEGRVERVEIGSGEVCRFYKDTLEPGDPPVLFAE